MYGTSKQNAFLFSETSRALIDSAETLPTKVRLTLHIVMTKMTGLIDIFEKTSFWST